MVFKTREIAESLVSFGSRARAPFSSARVICRAPCSHTREISSVFLQYFLAAEKQIKEEGERGEEGGGGKKVKQKKTRDAFACECHRASCNEERRPSIDRGGPRG